MLSNRQKIIGFLSSIFYDMINGKRLKMYLLVLFCVFVLTACNAQNRNDLLSMHFDQPIT